MVIDSRSRELLCQAETIYDIEIVSARFAGQGSGNLNFFVETACDIFVLCVIEEQSTKEVDDMARTLEWLKNHGYPTTTLRRTADGSLTTKINGKPVLMRCFLHGEVCWMPSAAQVRQVGISIANLHTLPCPPFLRQNIYYARDRFLKALHSGHDRQYETWILRSLERINIESYSSLPRGFVHADVFSDNVLFNEEELVAIIDFELACNYTLVFDLAMAIVGMCFPGGTPCFHRINSLINGYQSVRLLSDSEKRSVKPMTEYAAVMTSIWRYWRYQCYEIGHPKQYAYRELVNIAEKISASKWDLDQAL